MVKIHIDFILPQLSPTLKEIYNLVVCRNVFRKLNIFLFLFFIMMSFYYLNGLYFLIYFFYLILLGFSNLFFLYNFL
jgi:hypothetical protein